VDPANTASGPVLKTTDTNAPSTAAVATTGAIGKVSRGYTEEMEHFCYCIRENNFESREKGGLRCNGTHAMGDAIMALTSNLAMKLKKRIEIKESWFDPNSDEVPEKDPQVLA
jgi:hypothetical protein